VKAIHQKLWHFSRLITPLIHGDIGNGQCDIKAITMNSYKQKYGDWLAIFVPPVTI